MRSIICLCHATLRCSQPAHKAASEGHARGAALAAEPVAAGAGAAAAPAAADETPAADEGVEEQVGAAGSGGCVKQLHRPSLPTRATVGAGWGRRRAARAHGCGGDAGPRVRDRWHGQRRGRVASWRAAGAARAAGGDGAGERRRRCGAGHGAGHRAAAAAGSAGCWCWRLAGRGGGGGGGGSAPAQAVLCPRGRVAGRWRACTAATAHKPPRRRSMWMPR